MPHLEIVCKVALRYKQQPSLIFATSDAGQAALPGGKSDALSESPWETARREAFEEIGLPLSDDKLPPGYKVEHLTELPANLAMTELGVRPCVAWLKTSRTTGDISADLLPKLDAKEVAAVFTAPFHNFLSTADEDPQTREKVEGKWYQGSWHSWHEEPWRMHQFYVPVSTRSVFRSSKPENTGLSAKSAPCSPKSPPPTLLADKKETASESTKTARSQLKPPLPSSTYQSGPDALAQPRYRVFGMTARILVDCARVAYGQEPEFEHNSHFGDEDMIGRLMRIGRLSPIKKHGEILTRDVMMKAKKEGSL